MITKSSPSRLLPPQIYRGALETTSARRPSLLCRASTPKRSPHGKPTAHDHQTIAFCITRAHGREIADRFRLAGIATAYADGAMQPAMRDRAIADFSSRRAQVICAVDLLGEGVDIPGASCALLLRPTRSVVRHNQAIGRVIRPHSHPSGLSVIVDCVGNCRTLGGPRTDHTWALDGVDRQRAGKSKT